MEALSCTTWRRIDGVRTGKRGRNGAEISSHLIGVHIHCRVEGTDRRQQALALLFQLLLVAGAIEHPRNSRSLQVLVDPAVEGVEAITYVV